MTEANLKPMVRDTDTAQGAKDSYNKEKLIIQNDKIYEEMVFHKGKSKD